MSLLPLFIVACALHVGISIACVYVEIPERMGRIIIACSTAVGALFLMCMFWLYEERLVPQLDRKSWPRELFNVQSASTFGNRVVYTLLSDTVTVFWVASCPSECNAKPDSQIMLHQNPNNLNELAMNVDVDQQDVTAVIMCAMPVIAAWVLLTGLGVIYFKDRTVAQLFGYDAPPPPQAMPEGYTHDDPPSYSDSVP